MTRKEWMEKNLPAYINNNAGGGVIGCPRSYRELIRIDPSVCINKTCKKRRGDDSFDICKECWNMELNVKKERRTMMTRREFVLQNYGKKFVNDTIPEGIRGCPGSYEDLVALDPSCNALRIGQPSCKENGLTCTECWNAPLPEEGVRPSDKVEIRKTMGEPHIGDTFYTIVPIALGKYQLYIVGEFIINLMSSINDRQVRCSAFDDRLAYQYTFFYDLVDKTINFNYEVQRQVKNTPNLDRSLFLERRDAIEALEKWTGNVSDKSYYFLKQKGE